MTEVAEENIKASAALPRLGEELPIFCEACGYSLHGLPRIRCERCEVLHFHCPECGHHQAINTLRPAVQKMLGRLRAWWLGFSVFFRLNYFGWLLVAWAALGDEVMRSLMYRYQYSRANDTMITEISLATIAFGVGFGLVSRMFLLRWRKGAFVGLILGALTALALLVGAYLWHLDRRGRFETFQFWVIFPFMLLTFISVSVGTLLAWPSWVALVMLFLPKRIGKQLLDWQRSLSDASALARS